MRHVRIDRLWSRCLRAVGALGLAGTVSSCFDIEQSLVLNPDGSGKMTMTTAVAMPDLKGLEGFGKSGAADSEKKLTPREQARGIAVEFLRAEGIEAWSNVTYGVGKDGKTRASATGYFRDVTKVRRSNPIRSGRSQEDLGVSKNSDGHWVIEDHLDSDAPEDPSAAPSKGDSGSNTPPLPLTDEEVRDKLDEERQQWAGMKPFLAGFFENLRMAITVQGGGSIVDSTGFEKKDERTAVLEFTGKTLLDRVDALLQDDEKARALLKSGLNPTDGNSGPEEFFKLAFGGNGTMRVTLKPGAPAFDYEAELAQAKASESEELRLLLKEAKEPNTASGLPGQLRPGPEDGSAETPESDTHLDESDEDSPHDPPARKRPRQID